MEIIREEIDDMDVLTIKGRLDAASSKNLKQHINALVETGRVKIVMDLSGMDFIDSSGLGVLVGGLRSVSGLGGDIKIASLQNRIRAVFELTRLHRVLSIFNDRETALQSF